MPKELIIPAQDQAIYDGWHFSPGVRVGDTIYVSGQVGVNEKHEPADGIEAQTRLAFQNLERVLAKAGATLADVVEMTTFHINLQADLAGFTKVKDEFLPDKYPAWTPVGTTELALPGLLVEIRATACLGAGG